jgi:hypothetical protein
MKSCHDRKRKPAPALSPLSQANNDYWHTKTWFNQALNEWLDAIEQKAGAARIEFLEYRTRAAERMNMIAYQALEAAIALQAALETPEGKEAWSLGQEDNSLDLATLGYELPIGEPTCERCGELTADCTCRW